MSYGFDDGSGECGCRIGPCKNRKNIRTKGTASEFSRAGSPVPVACPSCGRFFRQRVSFPRSAVRAFASPAAGMFRIRTKPTSRFYMPGERMPSAAKVTDPGGSFRKRERIAVGLSAGTFGSAMLSARTPETVVGKCLRKTERSELDGFAVRRVAETVSPTCPFCGRIAAKRDSGAFERRVAECSENDRNDIFSTDERSCRTNACGSGYVFEYIGPRSSLCWRRYAVRVMLPVCDGPAARIGRFGCGHRATTGAVRFRTSLTGGDHVVGPVGGRRQSFPYRLRAMPISNPRSSASPRSRPMQE